MFDISNEIAYDGLMIEATDPTLARAFTASYPIPAEGDEVDRILTHLGKIEFHLSQVMAISPFRDIAQPLRERADANSGLTAGTIHTAQGRRPTS